METTAAAGPPMYEDFVPSYKLVRDEGIDTIIIELPEFQKEQIGVQLESFGKLSVSGERPLADNRRSRFRNTFEVPKECSEIGTRFENGHLYLKILPKLNIETSMEADIKIKETRVKDQPTQARKPEKSQKPTSELKPSTGEPNGVPPKQDEKRGEPTDTRKDAEKVGEKAKDQSEEKKGKEKLEIRESGTGKDGINQEATLRPSAKPNGVPPKQQDEKRSEPTDMRKDAEKVGEKAKDQTEEKKGKEKFEIRESGTGKDGMNQEATSRPSAKPNGVPPKQQDGKRGELTDTREDPEKVGEKEKDQTEEKIGKDKVDIIVSVPVNLFVAIVLLLMIVSYFTSKG